MGVDSKSYEGHENIKEVGEIYRYDDEKGLSSSDNKGRRNRILELIWI